MLEEYQAQTQTIIDLLNQATEILTEMVERLHSNYPEEDRTFRMGQAMQRLSSAFNQLISVSNSLSTIEWPTEDRPR